MELPELNQYKLLNDTCAILEEINQAEIHILFMKKCIQT